MKRWRTCRLKIKMIFVVLENSLIHKNHDAGNSFKHSSVCTLRFLKTNKYNELEEIASVDKKPSKGTSFHLNQWWKKVQNHPFTKINTAIIRTCELSCEKVFMNDSKNCDATPASGNLEVQQPKQESPSMTQDIKVVSTKIKHSPCHNTSSVVNFFEKYSGKKWWQLAYFFSNWFEFWHAKETSKQFSEPAVTTLYYIWKWILYKSSLFYFSNILNQSFLLN